MTLVTARCACSLTRKLFLSLKLPQGYFLPINAIDLIIFFPNYGVTAAVRKTAMLPFGLQL